MHLIESYGTGILKIKRNYENNTKKPIFETAPGVFRVTLPNTYQDSLHKYSEASSDQNNTDPNKGTFTMSNSELKILILEYVDKNGEITRKEVENMLGVKTTKAYTLLRQLCKDHELKSVGQGYNAKYIRY